MISDKIRYFKDKLNSNCSLLAVSKTKPIEDIQEALNAGQIDFGENKVQDLYQKSLEFESDRINWHFIGHLQSNKINQLLKVKNLVSIHSVDSLKLLKKLLNKNYPAPIGLFLQVNTSGENEKSGFTSSEALKEAINLILQKKTCFYLQGLMTIGKIRTENFEEDARSSFLQLKQLKKEIDNDHDLNIELSMGMSQDFEIAQEFGANWVRIGSAIFGKRE